MSRPYALLKRCDSMRRMALPITSVGRFSPRGPLSIRVFLQESVIFADRFPDKIFDAFPFGLRETYIGKCLITLH